MKKLSIQKVPTSFKEAISAFNSDNNFLKPVIEENFLEIYLNNLV